MESKRTQADRSARTRAALVEAARPLFATRGYAEVATDELARAAGVTRGALYHQFDGKPELFAAVFEAVEAEIAAEVDRAFADAFADVLPVEAFGAIGDGVTNDGDALDAALASGRPVLLGPRTYARRGQWTIGVDAVLLGTPGCTRLRQLGRAGGAFISVQGARFTAHGVAFDAGGVADGWCVLVTPTCRTVRFDACTFTGAAGALLGCGLAIQGPADPASPQSQATILGCEFHSNQVHGLWIQCGVSATVQGCTAHANGAYGLCVDDNDPALRRRARRVGEPR